jgi:LysM repeat protein
MGAIWEDAAAKLLRNAVLDGPSILMSDDSGFELSLFSGGQIVALNKKWKDTIDTALTDARWDGYDKTIKDALGAYTGYLKSTPGYAQPDSNLIKAMVWTETGLYSPDWPSMPMQIGKFAADKGLADLLDPKGRGSLILPRAFQSSITVQTVQIDPAVNIQAGIGYLLKRHAAFSYVNVEDPDSAAYDYSVRQGDTFEKIARRNATTVEEIERLNSRKTGVLKPKDVLRLRNAAMQWRITGWTPVTALSAALLYNGGGDADYAEKLKYCMSVIGNLKR